MLPRRLPWPNGRRQRRGPRQAGGCARRRAGRLSWPVWLGPCGARVPPCRHGKSRVATGPGLRLAPRCAAARRVWVGSWPGLLSVSVGVVEVCWGLLAQIAVGRGGGLVLVAVSGGSARAFGKRFVIVRTGAASAPATGAARRSRPRRLMVPELICRAWGRRAGGVPPPSACRSRHYQLGCPLDGGAGRRGALGLGCAAAAGGVLGREWPVALLVVAGSAWSSGRASPPSTRRARRPSTGPGLRTC